MRLPVWPRVAAVVPARNEAETIAESIGSLLRQDYPGAFTIILVDDDSSDGTAAIAQERRAREQPADRLRVVTSRGLPAGWTGKLWALKQGIDAAGTLEQPPDYLLLTDADIVHDPGLRAPPGRPCRAQGLVLTSLMAKLRCESFAERASIPAFIFFFQMLYPFALGEPARQRASRRPPAAACWCAAMRCAKPAASRPSATR